MDVTDRKFNPSGDAGIDAIKEAALAFAQVIKANTPEGRRRSLALTHLETCSMFAVKAAVVGDA